MRYLLQKRSFFFKEMRRCDDVEERFETDGKWLLLLVDKSFFDCLVTWSDDFFINTPNARFKLALSNRVSTKLNNIVYQKS